MYIDFKSPYGKGGGFQGGPSAYGSIGDINETPYLSRNVDKYLTPGISPGSAIGATQSGAYTPHSANSRWNVNYSEKDSFQQQKQQQQQQQAGTQSKMASQSLLFGRSNSYQLEPPNMMRSSSDAVDNFRNVERVEFAPITALVSMKLEFELKCYVLSVSCLMSVHFFLFLALQSYMFCIVLVLICVFTELYNNFLYYYFCLLTFDIIPFIT